ncbi:MerR family transcriptional regulator [Bifidobacterium sp. SMB2]|uniref:MerR family transcriptional regulator n=1 Tax=Bifidobacterium saimiriisciurei TaxID=2661627 RepID=A0ABX0CAJ1_9BIFI|nr:MULTISPECIES: MerR family transcriptional regulator [Bifidobacterium]NEG96860.1 MerR family transcriptional regulator [Bifidobacterium sp. SMB2]NEH11610.1 MerR family transcriptional regulator [Bifidobacterium saimiriisciurei]
MDGANNEVRLSLHVPLRERTSLGAADAVQGQLFEGGDARHERRGYRGTVASRVAGITYRQLDYWARKQIVVPSINPSHGSGSRRLYSFKDVVILAVSKKLLDAGVNLQNVTAAIDCLQDHTATELENITIMCDGQTVHECTTDEEVIALVRGGAAVFGVSVGALWHHTKEALDIEEFVDLSLGTQQHDVRHSQKLDDITRRRMQKTRRANRNEGKARIAQ